MATVYKGYVSYHRSGGYSRGGVAGGGELSAEELGALPSCAYARPLPPLCRPLHAHPGN